MTAIEKINEVIHNLTFVTEQFGEGEFVTLSFYDQDDNEINSALRVMDDGFNEINITINDLAAVTRQRYLNDATVAFIAIVILNSNMDSAANLGHAIKSSEEFDYIKIASIIVTDGKRWEDIIAFEGGEVNSNLITDFQLRAMVEGSPLVEQQWDN